MSVQLSEGQTFGPRAINVTRTTLVRYAGASGDFNPIHYSDRAAREAGMDGVIAVSYTHLTLPTNREV